MPLIQNFDAMYTARFLHLIYEQSKLTDQAAETCLLVDKHKFLISAITHFLLEVDQFLNSLIGKRTFCLHQLLSFGSTLIEKPSVDFTVLDTQ